jgi:hypothetical protein
MIKAFFILISFPFVHASYGMPCDTIPPSVRDSIIQVLFIVDDEDQRYRLRFAELKQENKVDSQVAREIFKKEKAADSIDLVKVSAIVEKYGWLGPDDIGDQCNTAMFMVIQHADLGTQQRYLPMMREAEAKGKLKAHDLAMLEDRVNVFTGKKQVYGSQLYWDTRRNVYLLAPLEDPDHVDERRASVGLPPMKVYLADHGLTWDVEAYKKHLPEDVEYFKALKKD